MKHKGYNNVINGTDHPYGFGGKEENDELGLEWLDFHARNYDSALGRWMNIDPLAEDYYAWSPYNYSYNSPLKFTDPTGMGPASTIVKENEDGTYTVTGGDLTDGDKGIYVDDGNGGKGEKIGESLTMYSFFNDDKHDPESEQGWKGTIDPNSTEGADLLGNLKENEPSLFSYMYNATEGEKYDFKRLDENGVPLSKDDSRFQDRNYHHRGSVFGTDSNGNTIYASARDFGNYGAGYIAGVNDLGWNISRVAFNGLEQITSANSEGQQSVRAQKQGHNEGAPIGRNRVISSLKAKNKTIFLPSVKF